MALKKILSYVLVVILTVGCSSITYTHSDFFQCNENLTFVAEADKQKLIYAVLERAVVSEKDVPDYRLIADKEKIYIEDMLYSNIMNTDPQIELVKSELSEDDVPGQIGKVRFCLKGEDELNTIATSTSAFLYLTVVDLKVEGDIATVGIMNSWSVPDQDTTTVYLSGGGYICRFMKKNGEWVFVEKVRNWQS